LAVFEFPKVSVIIPTFNSAATLRTCLDSIRNDSYTNKEITIVDNFSTDETTKIAKEYRATVVLCKGFMSAARNKGIRCSSGEYILFLDSDEVIVDGAIIDALKLCKSGSHVVFFPPVYVGNDFWSSIRALLRNETLSTALSRQGIGVYMEPCLWNKDSLIKLGLFDEKLLYGEWAELYSRARLMGVRSAISKYTAYHVEPSLKKTVLKDLRYGYFSPKYLHAKKHYQNIFIENLLVLKKIIKSDRSILLKLGSFILLSLRAIARGIGFTFGIIMNTAK
jgi:glycosyltransferase involved in cell wall biosynthesis